MLSAVIVPDGRAAPLRAELARLRAALGRQPSHVLHFVKLSHSHRLEASADLARSSVGALTSVILHKNLEGQPKPARDVTFISRPDPMYLWALRLLIERVSWYVDEHVGTEAIVTFSKIKGFPDAKIHAYRAALERTGRDTEIRWKVFDGHAFRIDSPIHVELLQYADIAASALFHAVQPDEFGRTETRYLDQLSPVVYRRGVRTEVTSYGLKVFPAEQCAREAPLAWLRRYDD